MSQQHKEFEIHKAPLFTPTFFVCLAIVLVGFTVIGYRYFMGIGYVSNLSDGWPWGIWLAYDVAVGTAIACGGYALAITVYIMNKFRYHSMIRSAVLASMFGYAFAGLSVMVDIGRYWNAYNFFVPSQWQPNSAMFEVALCVMAYTVILILEFLPSVFEKFSELEKWPKLVKISKSIYKYLDKVLILIIAIGITLPTMHQSSLGSLYIVMGYKLHPLWQTMFLPLLFLLNAFLMGFAIVAFETVLSARQLKRPFEKDIISLSRIIPYIVATWIAIRFISLITSGSLSYAFSFNALSLTFWAEIILIAIAAYIIFATQYGKSQSGLFTSAMLLLIGGGLYRMSVYIIGFNPGDEWTKYFPSINEFMITVAFIALEILLYSVLVKLLPILPSVHQGTIHTK